MKAGTEEAKTVNVSQPSQLPLGDDDAVDDENLPDPRIWWETGRTAYRTNFPPPDGSDCHEHEQFGHRDYHRALTDAEAATMTARDDARAAKRRAADETERDAFFASLGEAESSCPFPLGEVAAEPTEGVSPPKPLRQPAADTSPKGERQDTKPPT